MRVNSMRSSSARIISRRISSISSLLVVGLALLLAGCSQRQESAQEVREKTADATATFKSDAKAVAEGVREGWSRDKPLDLNHATKAQLLDLPGISSDDADRVIDRRPYKDPGQLVMRHVVAKSEYDRISDRVTAK
jgi:DNA uptake protein ComE-like DNA-binding protein